MHIQCIVLELFLCGSGYDLVGILGNLETRFRYQSGYDSELGTTYLCYEAIATCMRPSLRVDSRSCPVDHERGEKRQNVVSRVD